MTSQVVILNLQCAAVASDSILTVGSQDLSKTITSTEKAFDLGSAHNVVCLLSGNASILEVPWAVVLAEWRNTLDSPLPRLEDYGRHLAAWLAQRDDFFSREQREEFLFEGLSALYEIVADLITDKLDEEAEDADDGAKPDQGAICLDVAQEALRHFAASPPYLEAGGPADEALIIDLAAEAHEICEIWLDEVPGDADLEDLLVTSGLDLVLTRSLPWRSGTTIAFVGFGADDLFPGFHLIRVDGIVGSSTRWWDEGSGTVDTTIQSRVRGIAQSDAVMTFIRAYDMSYLDCAVEAVEGILSDLRDRGLLTDDESYAGIVEEATSRIDEAFSVNAQTHFSGPLLDTVASLPPIEMARLAEALVGIQALRAAANAEQPTVGGAIEVALITRRGGVQWVGKQGSH